MSYDIDLILQRIVNSEQTSADIDILSQAILAKDEKIVQLGKYNVSIGHGDTITIGDHVFQGPTAQDIQHVLQNALKRQEEKDKKRYRTLVFVLSVAAISVAVAICILGGTLGRRLLQNFQRTTIDASSAQEPDTPPFYGVFIYEHNSYMKTLASEGMPDDLSVSPSVASSTPNIVLWYQGIDLDYLVLNRVEEQGDRYEYVQRIEYNASPGEQGVLRVILHSPLDEGIYCFVQGDMMKMPEQLLHFCFQVPPGAENNQ